MLDQVAAASRVPFEFVGLARQFRSAVKLVDVEMEAALDLITRPLLVRLRRKPTLRVETLPVIAEQYRTLVPARFRIGKTDGAKNKGDFAVTETWLCAGWLHDDEWGAADDVPREPGVSICKFTLSVHKGRLQRHWAPLCNVSLHALARRIERHQDRTSDALVRDITVLAAAGEDGDRVDSDRGFWLGGTIDAGNRDTGRTIRIRSVRTWIGAADG